MANTWSVYEVSTIEISTGGSVQFQEGFYKILAIEGVLTSAAAVGAALAVNVSGTTVCGPLANWLNTATGAPLAAGATSGSGIKVGTWSSTPVISAGQTLAASSTGVSARIWVTIAKVGGQTE